MENKKNTRLLAYALKLRRKEAGVSVKDVAEKLNVNPNTVYAWESGQNVPGGEILIELCDMYHADICDFIVNSNELKKKVEISNEESELIELYRNATSSAKETIINVLRSNQRQEEK